MGIKAWGLKNRKTGKVYPEAYKFKKHIKTYSKDQGYDYVRVEIREIKKRAK